jgi:predicted TIM-barrel fold metal-dependent hydrolase
MSYAGDRRIVDADSHLMEQPDFLTRHVDPAVRDALPVLTGGRAGLDLTTRQREAGEVDRLVALGDELTKRGPKWHAALGAVDGGERSLALDLLGFEHQVVYSSLCAPLFSVVDPDVRYAAYRAHNRAVAEFCSADHRLLGVAMCDLDDVDRAVVELDAALDLGAREVWLPARAPGGRSPGHPDHDRFWGRLAERGVPFVLHVGSGPLPIDDEWMNDGRPALEHLPGAEVLRSKDMTVVYQPVERFLSVLVLDGLLERFPGLRGGAIEMGADWVPAMLRRLDLVVEIWSRPEPRLAQFGRRPSEQASAQLRFTPYPFEDVGRLCRDSDPALYLFSSDYPHAEGGRDPIGRFGRSLVGLPEPVMESFLHGSAAEWLGLEDEGAGPQAGAGAGVGAGATVATDGERRQGDTAAAHSEEVRP